MKRIAAVASFSLVMLALYSAFCGRLFPYSPVTPGFQSRTVGRAVVYHRGHCGLERLDRLDELMAQVERFHDLGFRRPVGIYLCGSDDEYRRYTGTGARFVAFPRYGRLFVSRRAWEDARRGDIDLDIYLRHELSHSLIYQQMGVLRALRLPRWLLEGVAMAGAGQVGTGIYPSKDEVFALIRQGYFFHPDDYGTVIDSRSERTHAFPLENSIAFIYSEFGCIVGDLISRYGNDRFHRYLRGMIRGGEQGEVFRETYGTGFEEYLALFLAEARR
ncbi:MAG: hypothetical protein JXA20_19400 [Spirochaetes bacterium]|nr:hypothetical protein [Spirochaetota bacterium]